jgi:hypothetical protein
MHKADWLEHTSPAFRLLIATSWLAPVQSRDKQDKTIREAIAAAPDWIEYLRLIDRHDLNVLSWAALTRVTGLTIPEDVAQRLQGSSEACRIHAIRHSLVLTGILREFNRAGIPVMPFKGPLLSFALYGDVGLRRSFDLDVAVAKDDLQNAMACLENIGWTLDAAQSRMSPRQWNGFLQNGHHVNFTHSVTGSCLELHWRNYWEASEAADARWLRSQPSVWNGCAIRIMCAADLTLYLCTHAGVHLWSSAKWLGDLARAHAVGLLDWRAAGEENALLSGLGLLDVLYGDRLSGLPTAASIGSPSALFELPLRSLQHPQLQIERSFLATVEDRFRTLRYERLVRPRAWRDSLSELFYGESDYQTLRLPDNFFWLYRPLRPLLWIWRWVRRKLPKLSGPDVRPQPTTSLMDCKSSRRML